ncbi:phosphopentomutase [Malaya genurostris]|uniref:phosphopentomutase n=1 Tax=Malaya genurostris TaxID=325434 RepID=UPI0026F3A026|nr:phosphopentomutase [Malaya genurostris]XP_058446882.1 phosphopentomutase [Malaya genurostris]XP_058446883.1 phosphopentomutase [Malaya genurostris]XP_058446884.1 phosphopentomutase [Malaya genurostris]
METDGIHIDSGSPELDQKISEWLQWDKNENTLNEIRLLVKDQEWKILSGRLLQRLAFGTAGLRGVMQAGFNAMNDLVVVQSAQGLCNYILECYPTPLDRKRGVVLGFDGRYNSKRFAELSACVFLTAGIPVWLYSRTVATPFVPFAIQELQCLAGIMVTASHNPKEDNGYKVYWTNSAQIISPHDKNIQTHILRSLAPLESSWNLDLLKSDQLKDPYDAMSKLYFEKLAANVPENFVTSYNAKSSQRFVYSAMHGVGFPFVELGFQTVGLQPVLAVQEQRDPDPEFPTVKFPNPEEGKSSLLLSIKLANESNCDVILANDPDADRLACAEKNSSTGEWRVFTGNELGSLLGWWSVRCYREQYPDKKLEDCYLLASTVSSKMCRSIANIEGLNFEETLTGFKWMGNKSVELMKEGKTVLFAFEEAIGFMCTPTVLDKDGVSAACQLATMVCYLQATSNQTLTDKLNELYDIYGYHCTITSYHFCYDPVVIERIFERIRTLETGNPGYPKAISAGKYPIASVRDLTTGYDSAQTDRKAQLPSSKSSQMITFSFENGAVITLRTSGTEPKIKYYAEMCAKPGQRDWDASRATLRDMVDCIVEELLEPVKNNLTPRSE